MIELAYLSIFDINQKIYCKMASKKKILNKIRILITQKFDSPEDAFNFFDKDSDGKLNRKEIVKLLKE